MLNKEFDHQKKMSNNIWKLVPDLLLHIRIDGTFLAYNQPKNMELYLPPDLFVGKKIQQIFPLDIALEAIGKIELAIKNDSIEQLEYKLSVKNEFEYYEARFVKYTIDTVLVIVRDVTDNIRLKMQLEAIRTHDKLTGALNRNYFEEYIQHIARKNYNIMVCDIDGLKFINDSKGHLVGDELIKLASRLIKNNLAPGDKLFRFGGDEFVIFSPNDKMAKLYKDIKLSLDKFNEKEHCFFLSISIGWGQVAEDGDVTKAFEIADQNMYKEKLAQGISVKTKLVEPMLKQLKINNCKLYINIQLMKKILGLFLRSYQLSKYQANKIYRLIDVHDIGSTSISHQELLFSQKALSLMEKKEIYRHSEVGFRILNLSSRYMDIADLVLKHHENWNGSGYPLGLKRMQIPVECRIFRLIDSFQSIISVRPYRTTFLYENAIMEIQEHKGNLYDPELTKLFLQVVTENKDTILNYNL